LPVDSAFMGFWFKKFAFEGVFIGDLFNQEDLGFGQVLTWLIAGVKKMPISEFSLSSSMMVERSNSEEVGVEGIELGFAWIAGVYFEGVFAGV
jgi:hypothetical protein